MKIQNNTFKKYFVIIWGIIALAYSAILFTLVANIKTEIFHTSTFWVAYIWMMVSLILWLAIECIEKPTKNGNIKPVSTFVYPYLIIVFVITTLLYFFATKITNVDFVFIPMILFSAIFVIFIVLGMMNQKMVRENAQTLKEINKVEDLSAYFQEASQSCQGQFRSILEELAKDCLNLVSSNDERIISIDRRLIEYATFIKKNARNEEINIENNVKKFKELLKNREK